MQLSFLFFTLALAVAAGVPLTHVNSNISAPIVRGVNLGGWLVLEPWILPQFFEDANALVGYSGQGAYPIVDEWTWWAHVADTPELADRLEDHWGSWVTQDHLKTLSAAGISHLRIPVGYWYFDPELATRGEPFAVGSSRFPKALDKLKTLVNDWAAPLGLKVLIDIHAAPGSQNGYDNSGKRGEIDMLNGDNTTRWEAIVAAVSGWSTDQLDSEALWGVEILNEPAGFYPWMWTAEKDTLNPKGYSNVRSSNDKVNVIFQTGFHKLSEQPQYTTPDYHDVWFDDHNYQCFGDQWNSLAWDPQGWGKHLDASCQQTSTYAAAPLPTVVGEFSLAVTDCTIFLQGGMNGGCDLATDPACKYTPTPVKLGHSDVCDYYTRTTNLPAEYKTFLGQFAAAQMDSFEAGNGWFFWNFRTENQHAPAWDFLLGLQEGWIGPNVANRTRFCQ